jgi:hypothetical protein
MRDTSASGCPTRRPGGYVSYDTKQGTFHLTAEQSFALAHEGCPAFIPGAFQVATAAIKDG